MVKWFLALSLLMTSSISLAAPYYEGPGCDENGNGCIFGLPSKRVVKWTRSGSIDELGSRCETFIQNIHQRAHATKTEAKLILDYRNFTYTSLPSQDQNGRNHVRCNVEVHSENPAIQFDHRTVRNMYWVCSSKNSASICRHYYSDCLKARSEALKDPEVIDATIHMGASLLQGHMCSIAIFKVKK